VGTTAEWGRSDGGGATPRARPEYWYILDASPAPRVSNWLRFRVRDGVRVNVEERVRDEVGV